MHRTTSHNKTGTRLAALGLLLALGSVQAEEVWTEITTPAYGGSASTLTGVVGSVGVTYTATTGPILEHLDPVHPTGQYSHIWDNNATGTVPTTPPYSFEPNNAKIYPASAATAPSQVVMKSTTAPGSQTTIAFAAPVKDPIVLIYSVERGSSVNLSGTTTALGAAAAIAATGLNSAAAFNITTQILSNNNTGAIYNATTNPNGTWGAALEGCSQHMNFPSINTAKKPSRACATLQLTGTYNEIKLTGTFNGSDGVGLTVGYNLPKISLQSQPSPLTDAANQVAECKVVSDSPVTSALDIPLSALPASTRYSSDCGAVLTIPAGSDTSNSCTITATPNSVAGDGNATATLSIDSSALPAQFATITTGTAAVEIQDNDLAITGTVQGAPTPFPASLAGQSVNYSLNCSPGATAPASGQLLIDANGQLTASATEVPAGTTCSAIAVDPISQLPAAPAGYEWQSASGAANGSNAFAVTLVMAPIAQKTLTVSGSVTGGPSTLPANLVGQTVTLTLNCTPAAAVPATVDLTIAANGTLSSATQPTVPAGSTCTPTLASATPNLPLPNGYAWLPSTVTPASGNTSFNVTLALLQTTTPPPVTGATPVPTLSEWALAWMATVLAGLAAMRLRQRKV